MKTKAIPMFAAAILMLALAFSTAVPAAPGGKTSPAPQPAAANASSPEEHPQIREAIAALRNAKGHLEHANHDFGGHRAEALRATEEALHQLQICLKYDK
jgi:hypothetical protein